MAEEKFNKKIEEEEGGEKEFLAREEIKTMAKDVAKLREEESKIEREKIAELKTTEEESREKERQERAAKEAEEREKAEKEAERKKEELTKLKEEREKKLAATEAMASKKEEVKQEALGEKLRETQTKEEEERRRFLERIAAKAEGKEEPPRPTEKIEEKAEKPFYYGPYPVVSQKPSIFEKVWIRIVVSLLVLAILAGIITFWYWFLVVRETPTPPASEQEVVPEASEVFEPSINERILEQGYEIPTIPRVIDTIIIHSTYNVFSEDPHGLEGAIQEYQYYGVAPHYVIARDGAIYRLSPDEAIAYHAGTSQMPDGRINVNNFSIGIELIQTKTETPDESQYLALAQLVKYLKQKYHVPSENILGHKDVSPGRKTDPWNFDWEKFNQLMK